MPSLWFPTHKVKQKNLIKPSISVRNLIGQFVPTQMVQTYEYFIISY